ncbi:MAG: hypothetical protein NTW19_09415 [Planctomycetota bacterium]|nr:hypothetical protein [Planctomycetota bacterium]
MSRHHRQSQALGEVWEILLRHRLRFILPAFVVMSGVLVVGMLLPRKYQGEAIFERRNDMVLAEIATRGASQTFQSPRGSISEELVGAPAIDELLAKVKTELASGDYGRRVAADTSNLRADLQRLLLVRFDISSAELDRVRLSYTSTHPGLARLVVNTLVENYIERTRAVMDDRLRKSAAFFEGEVENERKTIEGIENQMLTFEISHAEMLPESPNNIQASVNLVQTGVDDILQKVNAAKLREKALAESLATTSQTSPTIVTGANPDYKRMEDKLRDLESQQANCLGVLKMTERHPDLIALRAQIDRLKHDLEATPAETVTQTQSTQNPKRAEIELLLSTARAEREALETQLKTVQDRLTRLSSQSTALFAVRSDYRKLSRDADQHRRQLTFWEDNLRRVRMALAAESGNRGVQLNFLKRCDVVTRPVSPNLMQIIMAAVGLSMLAGAAGVFVAHRCNDSYTDADELAQATRLPLLGSVSEIVSDQQRRLRRLRTAVLYPINAVALVAVIAALVTLLYMSLERPETFERLKQQPAHFLLGRTVADAGAKTAPE